MLVEAQMDGMGNILVTPVSKKVQEQMSRHLKQWTGSADTQVFFQEGMGASEFLEDVPPRYRRDLDNGWPVRFQVDPWAFGHWVGYDFHEVIRP
jgi:hypothetical protein